jgi:hypothetical protein
MERIGDEYGYWYEGTIGLIEISWVKKFKGAWGKGVDKPEQFLSQQTPIRSALIALSRGVPGLALQRYTNLPPVYGRSIWN